MKVKTIAMILAVVMMVVGLVGATLAWLTATSDEVKNTFTTSDIVIELKETTGKEYKMVPGFKIAKDPQVTVKANSEDCIVFIQITKSSNYDTYLKEYEVTDGWTALTGAEGVYYRKVSASSSDQSFYVLQGSGTGDYKNGYVTVNDTVTKSNMEAIDGVDGDGKVSETEIKARPTLTFKAYAHQLYTGEINSSGNKVEFAPAVAWTNATATAAS